MLSIAAILVAVGAPVYSNYRKDSRREEGRAALEMVLAAEQAYYRSGPSVPGGRSAPGGQERGATFTTDRLVPPPEAASHPLKLDSDLTAVLAIWDIRVTEADAHGFTAVAAGRAGGPAAGLMVKLTYSRAGETRWEER